MFGNKDEKVGLQQFVDELCETIGKRLDKQDDNIASLHKLIEDAMLVPVIECKGSALCVFQLLDEEGDSLCQYFVDQWNELDGLITLNVAIKGENSQVLGQRVIRWPHWRVRPLTDEERNEHGR